MRHVLRYIRRSFGQYVIILNREIVNGVCIKWPLAIDRILHSQFKHICAHIGSNVIYAFMHPSGGFDVEIISRYKLVGVFKTADEIIHKVTSALFDDVNQDYLIHL